MTKPLKEIVFVPVQGIWTNVSGDSETFADFLTAYEITFDDKTEFIRLKDYTKYISIWIRVSAMKISVTIWKIPQN